MLIHCWHLALQDAPDCVINPSISSVTYWDQGWWGVIHKWWKYWEWIGMMFSVRLCVSANAHKVEICGVHKMHMRMWWCPYPRSFCCLFNGPCMFSRSTDRGEGPFRGETLVLFMRAPNAQSWFLCSRILSLSKLKHWYYHSTSKISLFSLLCIISCAPIAIYFFLFYIYIKAPIT